MHIKIISRFRSISGKIICSYITQKVILYLQKLISSKYITIYLQTLSSANYMDQITHIRAFGMDDVWANIGGYVGMVLGISIIQIIEMLNEFILKLKTNVSLQNHCI